MFPLENTFRWEEPDFSNLGRGFPRELRHVQSESAVLSEVVTLCLCERKRRIAMDVLRMCS